MPVREKISLAVLCQISKEGLTIAFLVTLTAVMGLPPPLVGYCRLRVEALDPQVNLTVPVARLDAEEKFAIGVGDRYESPLIEEVSYE